MKPTGEIARVETFGEEPPPYPGPAVPRPDGTRWLLGESDHTNSGGFCSCCGVVYPCRAARSSGLIGESSLV